MFERSDFAYAQNKEGEPLPLSAPFDFFEHVAQQNKRDEDSRVEYRARKEPIRTVSYAETCQRCGKDLNRVFVLNGKRLCRSCVDDEKKTWALFRGSPGSSWQRVPRQWKKDREHSLIESLISRILALFGLMRIDKVIRLEPVTRVAEQLIPRWAGLRAAQMPDKKRMPDDEGIMRGVRRRKT